jgi:5-methylcytosine-specific restriction protein A
MPFKAPTFRPAFLGPAGQRKVEHDRRRADDQPWRGWYSLAIWRNPRDGLRIQQLRRQPLCETCIANGVRPPNPATIAHHKTPHEGDWQLFIDPSNHASACKSCHDSELQSEERRARDDRRRGGGGSKV